MDKVKIGEVIAERRSKLSLTQQDLSEMTGVTSKTIYLVESGKANPSLSILQKLLDVLGMEIFIDIKKTDE